MCTSSSAVIRHFFSETLIKLILPEVKDCRALPPVAFSLIDAAGNDGPEEVIRTHI
jgi:hypothetical protein